MKPVVVGAFKLYVKVYVSSLFCYRCLFIILKCVSLKPVGAIGAFVSY